MESRNEFLGRTYIVLGVFLILGLVILFKVFTVTIVEGDKWRAKGGVNVKYVPIASERGNIYAVDGRLLATSLPYFEVRMDLSVPSSKLFESKIDSLSYMLSAYIDNSKSPSQWKRKLVNSRSKKKNGYRYFPIASKLDYDDMRFLKSFPIFNEGRYGGGLIIVRHSRRAKPFGGLAARTVGVDRENAQKIGLEGYFDSILKGSTEEKLMKKISGGMWVPVYDPSEFGVKKGSDIVTNLDMDIQDVAASSLTNSIRNYDAAGGTAIVMEVKTGKVVAMANLTKDAEGDIYEGRNYAVGRLSEPGSTMKTAAVLSMLEDGYVDEDTEIDLYGGKRKFYDKTMYDSHIHGMREVSMKKAFSMSSNVGIGGLAFENYERRGDRKKFTENLRRFGLGSMTEIEIVGEGTPDIKDPVKDKNKWWGTTIPWMAHGYEMLLTPLQVLRFYNAIANDGVMMKPYLVSKILHADGTTKEFKPKVVNAKIASIDNIRIMQDLLAEVVENGTASKLKSKKYKFSGKTGTTRVNYAKKEERKIYNASFSGYFPTDDPMYSVIVVVYDPKTAYYGSSVAGSVFKAIADKCFATKLDLMNDVVAVENPSLPGNHKGYKRDFENIMSYVGIDFDENTKGRWVNIENANTKMRIENQKIEKSKVPDVRGMGVRDAVYVLENIGLTVKTNGYGRVSLQSIKPGTKVVGQEINLSLR